MKKIFKKNTRGFTLIELIIAMSIFSIVIAMGYSVINKYSKTVGEQKNTTDVQMAINTINKYITNDLEKASGVTLKTVEPNNGDSYSVTNGEDGKEDYLRESLIYIKESNKILASQNENKLTYQYTIDTADPSKSPKYTVELKYNKNSTFINCSVSRSIEDGVSIDLISNHKIKKTSDEFVLPLVINNTNPYNVAIELEENTNRVNTYSFDVASRYIYDVTSEGEIKPPDITLPAKYNAVGFWAADKTKLLENNLLTWVNGSKKEDLESEYVKGNYANQKYDKDDIFKFHTVNSANGNSGHTDSKIGYEISYGDKHESYVNKADTLKPKDIKKVYIYISENMTVSNLEDNKGLIKGVVGENGNLRDLKLNGGNNGKMYEFILGNRKFKYYDISGMLSIDTDDNGRKKVNSGYALIMYGGVPLG